MQNHVFNTALVKRIFVALFIVGAGLFATNIYGLFQTLRPANFETHELRFGNSDISLSKESFREQVARKTGESELDYSKRITSVIADGIAHIHWEAFDPDKFNQTVPFWENYILWAMGKLKVTPEFERYHFSNVEKSIERGIGICGDASMMMSQLLDRQGIPNQIITVPGHVMVEAQFDENKIVFDPDFGVVLPGSAQHLNQNPQEIGNAYSSLGYTENDDVFMTNSFSIKVNYWDGIQHFITKKYYFEKLAYILKWLLPLLFMLPLFVRPGKSNVV